jgi:Mrr restriction endonuclease-like protein
MNRIPHARGVRLALRALGKATQASLKGLNKIAGQRMAKGDYMTAQQLAAKGTQVREFQLEIERLRVRWKELGEARDRAAKSPITPLWLYYEPILQALASLGGEARRSDLEAQVERMIAASLQAGDRAPLARGRERWRVMIQRARKHLRAERWIEAGGGPVWKITDAGRAAADKTSGKTLP